MGMAIRDNILCKAYLFCISDKVTFPTGQILSVSTKVECIRELVKFAHRFKWNQRPHAFRTS